MKTHSTMSRRDFMKALGFGTAGVGAAAVAMGPIRDLDELLSASPSTSTATQKKPWWVKERKYLDPPVKIDWDMMKRYDRTFGAQPARGQTRYYTREQIAGFTKEGQDFWANNYANGGRPGYDIRWRALQAGKSSGESSSQWTGHLGLSEAAKNSTPNAGQFSSVPYAPWSGTPEEASALLTAAMRYYGALWVGYQTLDDKWRNKLLVKCTTAMPAGDWPDVGDVAEDDKNYYLYDDNATEPSRRSSTTGVGNSYVIPTKKEQSIIVFATGVSMELMKAMWTTTSTPNSTIPTNFHDAIAIRTAKFIRALTGDICYGDMGHQTASTNFSAATVFSGIAENARQNLFSMTPEVGPALNPTNIHTSLKLAPTNPIDAGMWKFCQTCGKCAETCPSESIPKSNIKASYDIPEIKRVDGVTEKQVFHNPGYEGLWANSESCYMYRSLRVGSGTSACSVCYGNCTFTEDKAAMIHNMVRATITMTPLFNGFFAKLSDPFGFGQYENPDVWWKMALPSNGWDSTIGTNKGAYR